LNKTGEMLHSVADQHTIPQTEGISPLDQYTRYSTHCQIADAWLLGTTDPPAGSTLAQSTLMLKEILQKRSEPKATYERIESRFDLKPRNCHEGGQTGLPLCNLLRHCLNDHVNESLL
jgi:hypothetical protein